MSPLYFINVAEQYAGRLLDRGDNFDDVTKIVAYPFSAQISTPNLKNLVLSIPENNSDFPAARHFLQSEVECLYPIYKRPLQSLFAEDALVNERQFLR